MCTHTCVSRRVISYKYVSGGWESRNILTAGVRHLSITDPCLDKDRFFSPSHFFDVTRGEARKLAVSACHHRGREEDFLVCLSVHY